MLFLGFAAWTLRRDDGRRGRGGDAAGAAGGSIVLSVATAMFVAELGDKTMLATATLAAQGNPVLVWIGATIGIILAGTLGVLLGRCVRRPPARAGHPHRLGGAVRGVRRWC